MARPSPPSICDRVTTTIATAGKRSRTSGLASCVSCFAKSESPTTLSADSGECAVPETDQEQRR